MLFSAFEGGLEGVGRSGGQGQFWSKKQTDGECKKEAEKGQKRGRIGRRRSDFPIKIGGVFD